MLNESIITQTNMKCFSNGECLKPVRAVLNSDADGDGNIEVAYGSFPGMIDYMSSCFIKL